MQSYGIDVATLFKIEVAVIGKVGESYSHQPNDLEVVFELSH